MLDDLIDVWATKQTKIVEYFHLTSSIIAFSRESPNHSLVIYFLNMLENGIPVYKITLGSCKIKTYVEFQIVSIIMR